MSSERENVQPRLEHQLEQGLQTQAVPMNRSDLVERLWTHSRHCQRTVTLAVKTIIAYMSDTLLAGEGIEIRGFGSFSLRYRAAQPKDRGADNGARKI